MIDTAAASNTHTQGTNIIETPTGFVIEMTLSDAPDLEDAANFVRFRVTLDTDDRFPRLAKLQQAALARARVAIQKEIERLQLAEGRPE